MKNLILLLILFSAKSYSWSVQNAAYCNGLGFEVDFRKYCIPEGFHIDTLDADHVLISSNKSTNKIGFKFRSYAKQAEKNQEQDSLIYKGQSEFMGYKRYIHHLEMPDIPVLFRWTIVVAENEFYLQITGFSEQELSSIATQILASER